MEKQIEQLIKQINLQETKIESLMAEIAFLKDKLNQIYASLQR